MGSKKYNYQDVVKIFNDRGYELISTKDQYINVNSKLKYICPKHRDKGELTITFSKIRIGEGCPYCGRENQIQSAKKTLNINDAKLATEKLGLEYVGSYRNPKGFHIVKYICPKHRDAGIQESTIYHLKQGKGCPICGKIKSIQSRRIKIDEDKFKNIAESKGFEYVGYERKTIAPNRTKLFIKFICPKHRKYGIQEMEYSNIQRESLKGCKYCGKQNIGKTESEICNMIEGFGLSITRQKRFDDCRDHFPLPFDCYIDDYNTVVEYDGEQHYRPVNFGGCADKQAQEIHELSRKHDEIKNRYCAMHGINLIRIPYYETNNVKNFLINKFQQLHIPTNI